MYKKKEIIFIVILLVILAVYGYNFSHKVEKEEEKTIEYPSPIIIIVNGEISREARLTFNSSITYGVVILKIGNLLNEYSDLSNIDLYEKIDKSQTITINTLDINNKYNPTNKININDAIKEELLSLYQIGEKRSEKIINYIRENGRIKSWDEFWKITSVPDKAKDKIMEQAFLQ